MPKKLDAKPKDKKKPKEKTKDIAATAKTNEEFEYAEAVEGVDYVDFYGCRLFNKGKVAKKKQKNLGGLLQSISNRVSSKRVYKIEQDFMKKTAGERVAIRTAADTVLKKHLDNQEFIDDVDALVSDVVKAIAFVYPSIDKDNLTNYVKTILLNQIDLPNKRFKYKDRKELFLDEITVVVKKLDQSISVEKSKEKKIAKIKSKQVRKKS